ncbi:rRNA maturation RNase YbeY [Acidithiobacillus sp.]|jgi:probable rRNA maturation factor|uniref:rRNA maturation RNase YbeY n=1 Tax=Acidithiobacillus sp. TaxID=1872118 RepID=UPI0025BA38F9|nr:rRNA maturation RNase YbeY [Acidithiobacillus sp.]MCK9188659.1 rRNA maturation RNase YbeY [Acidithiobacillus sp.]MCK9360575.1 rRNA maturation RNase YbeY [Acidithiobacillus sp.]
MSRLYLRMAVDDAAVTLPLPSRAEARRVILRALSAPSARASADDRICELSLTFVADAEIAALNAGYRGKAKPTNCLSFPQDRLPAMFRRDLLGDIVIAPAVVMREAAEQGKRLRDHYRHLLIHSTLHLLGYDHEVVAEAQEMEALEIRLLAEMGVADPYLNQMHE